MNNKDHQLDLQLDLQLDRQLNHQRDTHTHTETGMPRSADLPAVRTFAEQEQQPTNKAGKPKLRRVAGLAERVWRGYGENVARSVCRLIEQPPMGMPFKRKTKAIRRKRLSNEVKRRIQSYSGRAVTDADLRRPLVTIGKAASFSEWLIRIGYESC